MVYEWKDGARIKANAQKIGQELEQIPILTPGNVLKAAKKKDTMLHDCFEWDDRKASEAYRLDQARYILRMIAIRVEYCKNRKTKDVVIRAFEGVSVGEPDGEKAMVYMPTQVALSDMELREQIFQRLMRTIYEAKRTAEKYTYLEPKFGKISAGMKDALDELEALI